MTTGFSRTSERQYAFWDTRDLTQPLIMRRLDDYPGIPMPFFDEDTKVVFIAGKGESAVTFYQYSTASPNYMDLLYAYKGKEPQKGFSFMPKRTVDVMGCEIQRGVRLTAKTIEYVSFRVPRKSGTFQVDLYPPCKSLTPSMTFEEYWAGTDKEYDRIELKPALATSADHKATVERKATFLSKLTGVKEVPFTGFQESPATDGKNLDHEI